MRTIFPIFLSFFSFYSLQAQNVTVSGQCITGNIILDKIANVNGKSAYQSTGTVDGTANVTVSIYWIGAPDNVWVIDFDGQPYYSSTCGTPEPPTTANVGCPWSVVGGTSCTGASPLFISPVTSLPVKLVSFTAQRNQNKDVELNWQTASESKNKGFSVQRSIDASAWANIAFINGAGNSTVVNNYQFIDKGAFAGRTYYRLLQQDFDGNIDYSAIKHVDLLQKAYYSITQSMGASYYKITINTVEKVELTLYDFNGRRIMNRVVTSGVQDLNLSAYPAGTYLLQLRRGSDLNTEKLLKQ